MPVYEYQAPDGRRIERFFRMVDSRPEVIVEEGVEYRRIYGNCQINGNPVSGRYPVASRSAPKRLKGWDRYGGFDPKGRPIIRSREDHNVLDKQFGLVRGDVGDDD